MFLLLAGGCGATVYPTSHPRQPVRVYVADYGIHSSLLLPTGEHRYVEYAFGDWNFAALNHTWPQDVVGALLISFQSALGRRYIDVAPGEIEPHPVHPSPHHLQLLYAPRERVEVVVREMDKRYRRDGTEVRYNPDNLMEYVKDSEHYSAINNCNQLTARCLREMGCEVRGLALLSIFHVVPAQTPIGPQTPAQTIETAGSTSAATMPSALNN